MNAPVLSASRLPNSTQEEQRYTNLFQLGGLSNEWKNQAPMFMLLLTTTGTQYPPSTSPELFWRQETSTHQPCRSRPPILANRYAYKISSTFVLLDIPMLGFCLSHWLTRGQDLASSSDCCGERAWCLLFAHAHNYLLLNTCSHKSVRWTCKTSTWLVMWRTIFQQVY